jgi:hypothetical protein
MLRYAMQGPLLRFCLVVALLLPLSSSCTNIAIFEPQVGDLVACSALGADNGPLEASSFFYVDSPRVCCSARISFVKGMTAVTARWVYVKGDRALSDDPLIAEQKAECAGDGKMGFTLAPAPSGFISGEYKVVWLIGDKEKAHTTFFIQKETSIPLPKISSFSAEPTAIIAGQPAVLTWQVSGASRVVIEPAISEINTGGTRSVNPATDTTYTLYALNRGGVSSSSIRVKVSQPAREKPDLIITEFWSSGNVLSYRVRNTGTAPSPITLSYLYKNGIKQSEDYLEPLNPGGERVQQFSHYHFSPRFSSVGGSVSTEGKSDAVNMRICVNADRSCPEADYQNNCFDHNFGPLWKLDLLRYASTADWQSSSGNLKWPMLADSREGLVNLSSLPVGDASGAASAMLLCPPQQADAWMQMRIGLPQGSPVTLDTFTIGYKCKFTAHVGLTPAAPAGASVKFSFGTVKDGVATYFPPVTVNSGSKTELYSADLGKLAGEEVEFVLRAEASAPLRQGCAAWIEPVIVQEY